MSRRAAILARLDMSPGLTAFELRRVLGCRSPVELALKEMRRAGLVVAVSRFRPDQGRMVRYWYLAPPGTGPAPRSGAEREAKRRRDRESKARRRARDKAVAALPGTLPSGDVPSLRGAACAGEDPELFFSPDPADIAKAKQVCAGCPVRLPCAQAADRRKERYGVWAGIDRDASHGELIAS